jgi:hypothetical protein
MIKHIQLLASLQIGLSILGIFIGLLIFGTFFGAGILTTNEEAAVILLIIGIFIVLMFFVTGLLGIVGGIGLFKYQNWARILILIVSAIDLINFPIGTALAVYSFIVLLDGDVTRAFRDGGTEEVTVRRTGS